MDRKIPKNKIRGYIGVKSNDGHDAAILVIADILKKNGIEIILGGYDLTVDKFVRAIIQEGVHFAGISSYNGGHIPFFSAVRTELQNKGYPHIHLIGGGGATITAEDIAVLEKMDGIDKIFKSGEGHLVAPFINDNYDFSVVPDNPDKYLEGLKEGDDLCISQWINLVEEKARLDSLLEANGTAPKGNIKQCMRYYECFEKLNGLLEHTQCTAYGICGRGGSGKSTITDELVLRFFNDQETENKKLAIVAVDPSSHSSGGALLADRIGYMVATDKNWVDVDRIYIRSVASRGHGHGIARSLPDIIKILKVAGYEIIVETYGTGQPDVGIVDIVDIPVFVTTPDMGGATQVAKEEMLNMPGVTVVLNKSEQRGGRHTASLLRNKVPDERFFQTTAIEHKNPGMDQLYQSLTSHYRQNVSH